jgi:hypothetical protein
VILIKTLLATDTKIGADICSTVPALSSRASHLLTTALNSAISLDSYATTTATTGESAFTIPTLRHGIAPAILAFYIAGKWITCYF